MTDTYTTIPHLPFYEALARLEESSPEWRATSAGLVTLRLVEQCTEARANRRMPDLLQLAGVEDAIESMESGDMRRGLLRSIFDAVRTGESSVLPRLMAYAKAEQFRAAWPLAVATYDVVLAHPGTTEQPDLALAALSQRGYCLRMAGDLDGAERSYAQGRQLALASNDVAALLRSDIGQSQLALHRGNLPAAQEMLDGVIAAATETIEQNGRTTSMEDLLARALLDRMVVASRRGQHEESLVFGHRALERAARPTLRDRILGDIGTALGELGYRDAARDAHLVLAATAEEQTVRWTATINLLELAGLDRNEPIFEQYRAQLAASDLPPAMRAFCELFTGEGYLRFHRFERAQSALERAIAVARKHGVNEVVIRAESALKELRSDRARGIQTPVVESEAIARIARSISRLRETAGVGIA